MSDPRRCAVCNRPERDHVWLCDKCEGVLKVTPCGCGLAHLPEVHTNCRAGATLYCKTPSGVPGPSVMRVRDLKEGLTASLRPNERALLGAVEPPIGTAPPTRPCR